MRDPLRRPLTFPRVEEPSPNLASEVTARIWPCVELQWEWLGGLPPLRKAAVVGAGSQGTAPPRCSRVRAWTSSSAAARPRRRSASRRERENADYLPAWRCDERIAVRPLSELALAGADLVVLAVPCNSLPAVIGASAPRSASARPCSSRRRGSCHRSAAALGLRRRAREGARGRCLGGPAHAREAVERGAAVVLASHDADLRRQLRDALEAGGLTVEAPTT